MSFDYTREDLFNPCLKAVRKLGGSAKKSEIAHTVIDIMSLSDDEVDDVHRGTATKLQYQLSWSLNYLKNFGLLENSSRGVWIFTEKGRGAGEVDPKEVSRFVESRSKPKKKKASNDKIEEVGENEIDLSWQNRLLEVLKKMDPIAFERLSQRLLRELGFENVEVTKSTGDGGIDGTGSIKIGSVITFRVVFQCKRYKKSVPGEIVRSFRGALEGRADKG
ncbi:MAG: Mrr restriction system protein, partial [Verrucomicrobiales bacterium]|nr:Mrr restriction system protein [Verrucomicrobiales bacterium]